MSAGLSDDELLRAAQADVPEAIEEFCRRFQPDLQRFVARRWPGLHNEVEEIVHDTLVYVLEHIRGGAVIREPRSFLRRCARNAAVSQARAQGILAWRDVPTPVREALAARVAMRSPAVAAESERIVDAAATLGARYYDAGRRTVGARRWVFSRACRIAQLMAGGATLDDASRVVEAHLGRVGPVEVAPVGPTDGATEAARAAFLRVVAEAVGNGEFAEEIFLRQEGWEWEEITVEVFPEFLVAPGLSTDPLAPDLAPVSKDTGHAATLRARLRVTAGGAARAPIRDLPAPLLGSLLAALWGGGGSGVARFEGAPKSLLSAVLRVVPEGAVLDGLGALLRPPSVDDVAAAWRAAALTPVPTVVDPARVRTTIDTVLHMETERRRRQHNRNLKELQTALKRLGYRLDELDVTDHEAHRGEALAELEDGYEERGAP